MKVITIAVYSDNPKYFGFRQYINKKMENIKLLSIEIGVVVLFLFCYLIIIKSLFNL